jgi:hypothetical protein
MKLFFHVAAILWMTGCAQRQMLIGIYEAPRSALPKLKDAGFNWVTMGGGETNRARFLDAARDAGIQVVASPGLNSEAARQATARLDQHPALWGWYLQDEPDLNLVSPATLHARKKRLRSIAKKRALVVVASGAAIEPYRDTADIMAVDWYPIPWAPLATLSREMRGARLAAQGRPFLAILQAFDWAAYRRMLVGDVATRAPTREELRCMAFLSLFQGASGLIFYTYQGAWKIEEHPQVWNAVTNVIAEVREKAPIFAGRPEWWPTQTRYESPGEMYNDIEEGSIALKLYRVRKQTGGIKPGYYFVAINTSQRPVAFSFRLPFRDIFAVIAACDAEGIALQGGWLKKRYDPFEICIFGPIALPLVSEILP